jgi:hypothetical protein
MAIAASRPNRGSTLITEIRAVTYFEWSATSVKAATLSAADAVPGPKRPKAEITFPSERRNGSVSRNALISDGIVGAAAAPNCVNEQIARLVRGGCPFSQWWRAAQKRMGPGVARA